MILLEGVEDHVEKANRHLRDLKAIRDRWKKNPLLKTSRDEIGHHLGNHAAFVKGLGRFNDGETLTLIERSTPSATSHRYPAAIETLLRGLAIDQSEFLTFATSATKDATAMLIVLERLFFDALASHGASVEIRAFMHRR
jgi:hypothetical protein